MGSEDAPTGIPTTDVAGLVGMSTPEVDLSVSFAAQDTEVMRALRHLSGKGRQETVVLLLSWMGTDQAKRMNDFWDERGGI